MGVTEKVILTDRTLCAESARALSFKEKLEILKQLDRMKADCVALGRIGNPKTDPLLIATVAPLLQDSTLAVTVGLGADEAEQAAAALRPVRNGRLVVSVPVSTVGMEYTCHKKPAALLEALTEQITRCRAAVGRVDFCAEDATRSEGAFLRQAIRAALAAGAEGVILCDTAGQLLPEALGSFLSALLADLPELSPAAVSVVCPDAQHLSVACAMAAVRAGVRGVHVAVDGTECTDVRHLAELLRLHGDVLGVSCGLRQTELLRCAGQIGQILHGASQGGNSPYSAAPAVRENGAVLVLDSHDDRDTVLRSVRGLGYDLTPEDEARVFEAFARLAAKKTVNAQELDAIVASSALQVPPTYRLVSYLTNSGNIISASAHIKLEKNGVLSEGIMLGDGPIDAAFLAIEQIIGHHYELDDFQIRSVTEGREAMGSALVRLRSGGKLYSGNGISTDIIGASIQAYLNALNKIVYEEAGE